MCSELFLSVMSRLSAAADQWQLCGFAFAVLSTDQSSLASTGLGGCAASGVGSFSVATDDWNSGLVSEPSVRCRNKNGSRIIGPVIDSVDS